MASQLREEVDKMIHIENSGYNKMWPQRYALLLEKLMSEIEELSKEITSIEDNCGRR